MSGSDAELEQLRAGVNRAALLERLPPVWQLDRKESTRRCLKYRRGKGETLIVNHDGRGWWDVHSDAKGDVFDLVQFLNASLNFGHVRRVLRSFVGVAPTFPEALLSRHPSTPALPLAERWRQPARLVAHRMRTGRPNRGGPRSRVKWVLAAARPQAVANAVPELIFNITTRRMRWRHAQDYAFSHAQRKWLPGDGDVAGRRIDEFG
jgi:hypothetical protein